jgi:hypothetical protein
MTNGTKIVYIGKGNNYGKTGEFDRYTNASKTRCRFFLNLDRGQIGFVGSVDNINKVES